MVYDAFLVDETTAYYAGSLNVFGSPAKKSFTYSQAYLSRYLSNDTTSIMMASSCT